MVNKFVPKSSLYAKVSCIHGIFIIASYIDNSVAAYTQVDAAAAAAKSTYGFYLFIRFEPGFGN